MELDVSFMPISVNSSNEHILRCKRFERRGRLCEEKAIHCRSFCLNSCDLLWFFFAHSCDAGVIPDVPCDEQGNPI